METDLGSIRLADLLLLILGSARKHARLIFAAAIVAALGAFAALFFKPARYEAQLLLQPGVAALDAYGTLTPTEPADVLLTAVQSGAFQETLRKQAGGIPFELRASLLEDPSFYGRSPHFSLHVRLITAREADARRLPTEFQSVLSKQFHAYIAGLRAALEEDLQRKKSLLEKAQADRDAYVEQNYRRIDWYEHQLALLGAGKPTAVPFGPADRERATEIIAEFETTRTKYERDADAIAAELKRISLQQNLTAPFLALEVPVARKKTGGLFAAIAGIGAGALVAAAGMLFFTTYDAFFPATRKLPQ